MTILQLQQKKRIKLPMNTYDIIPYTMNYTCYDIIPYAIYQ